MLVKLGVISVMHITQSTRKILPCEDLEDSEDKAGTLRETGDPKGKTQSLREGTRSLCLAACIDFIKIYLTR